MKNQAVLLSICLVLISCASKPVSGPKFQELAQEKEGYALVYVMRPAHDFGSAVWPTVYFNETSVVGLKNGGYTYFYAAPGTYLIDARKEQITSGPWGQSGEVTLEENETYFFSLSVIDEQTYGSSVTFVGGIPISTFGGTEARRAWVQYKEHIAVSILRILGLIPPNVEYVE